MEQRQLDRINYLYRKMKEEGLTPDEKEEQQRLRGEYIQLVRQNLRGSLDHTKVQEPDGTVRPLKKRPKKFLS